MIKPKFKVGDKVKVTLELEICEVGLNGKKYYYHVEGWECKSFFGWNPDCTPFDKIAKLVKKPVKKKVKP
jgi:hypothetical protein